MTTKRVPKARVTAFKPEPLGPGSEEDFTYSFPDGIEVTVPSLSLAKQPDFDSFTSAQTIPDLNVRQAVLTRLFLIAATGGEWDQIKVHSMDEVGEFINAWSEHSGVGLGE